jgi:ribulose-phosphate 3-epimerase
VSWPAGKQVVPSILSADFGAFRSQVVELLDAGARAFHVDVMDGHFVPVITFGPRVVSSFADLVHERGGTIDVHLMIEQPERQLPEFAQAGADSCTVHVELGDPRPLFDRMRALGMRVGLVFNPETPLEVVLPYLEEIDILLFMSVHPGFGGQSFIPEVLDKLRDARAIVDERGLAVELEIDGGINVATAHFAAAAGADILVSGSAIFHAEDPLAAAAEIRAAAWPELVTT